MEKNNGDLENNNTKGKLKNIFDEMDKKTKIKKVKNESKSIKTNTNTNIKSKDRNYKDYSPSKFKTKSTKPDFTEQFIQYGITGLNVKDNQYRGLTNFGNICYSNVIMQCLVSIKEFVTLINSIFKQVEDSEEVDQEYPILFNLVKIMSFYQGKI